MNRCPDCGSTQCILWDDGLLCLDCGTEFDESNYQEKEEMYF